MTPIQPLTLTGTPRKRGQAHGESLRAAINELLAEWQIGIERETGLRFPAYREQFFSGTDFLPAVRQHTPALLEEVTGIAEGAGVDFETIFLLQCMDEEWWFREKLVRSLNPPAHCSSIAIRPEDTRPALLAQNMDIDRMVDGRQALLDIRTGRGQALVFSFAGFIGLTGLNNQPLGVCCNTLSQLSTNPRGLPVAFIVRGVLEEHNLSGVESFLRCVPHASGQNYLIASRDWTADFECSASRVDAFMPGGERIFHTNHPLANPDLNTENPPAFKTPGGNSQARLELLTTRLANNLPAGMDEVQHVLQTAPVCVHAGSRGAVFTAGSLVMQMDTPAHLELTFGPPAGQTYQRFTLMDPREQ